MARVGFILKADSHDARSLLDTLSPWLTAEGHELVTTAPDAVSPKGGRVVEEDALAAAVDLAVVLGGDGTMLRAAGLVADAGVPVLGINLGRLGFLTPFDPASATTVLRQALAGSLKKSQRMRLRVSHVPKHGETVTQTAVNDAVIHQGAMARLVELSAKIDGDFVANYRADGLIIATPTGSTAYNLAAGGPIMTPRHQAMVLTPICAHALTNRPLVIDAPCTVSLTTAPGSDGVVVTVDGRWAKAVEPGDRIDITTSAKALITFESEKPYFDILREKLHWGRALGDPR